MKKRSLSLLILSWMACLSAIAVDAPALIIYDDTDFDKAWIVAASSKNIQYKVTEKAQSTEIVAREDVSAVYFIEPKIYKAGQRAFKVGKYKEALVAFQKCKKDFEKVSNLKGNYSVLAAFYEMECFRHLEQFDKLKAARLEFVPDTLLNATHKTQLNLYYVWEAFANEDWSRLATHFVKDIPLTKIGRHRVQVAYCVGVGQMKTDKPMEALISFAKVMTADAGASAELARKAAYHSMDILLKDELVKEALRKYGTEDEDLFSLGYSRLQQGGAVTLVYEQSFGIGFPLPAKYKIFKNHIPVQP